MDLNHLFTALENEVAPIRSAAARSMCKLNAAPDEAVPALIALLSDECSAVRNSAITSLNHFGIPAVEAIENAISSTKFSLNARCFAVTALSRFPEFAVDKFRVLFRSLPVGEPEIRQQVIVSIGLLCNRVILDRWQIHPALSKRDISDVFHLIKTRYPLRNHFEHGKDGDVKFADANLKHLIEAIEKQLDSESS